MTDIEKQALALVEAANDIIAKAIEEDLSDYDIALLGLRHGVEIGQRESKAQIEHQQQQLNQIAWLAQRPYDPNEQLAGGEDCASEGQAGSEA